jgi:hypothetical protein
MIGEDVRNDRHLAGDLDVAPEKFSEQRRDGSTREPVAEGMEDELVASVGIFLPASKLVVDSERDALFEPSVVISGETNNKATHLQAQRYVEIL